MLPPAAEAGPRTAEGTEGVDEDEEPPAAAAAAAGGGEDDGAAVAGR